MSGRMLASTAAQHWVVVSPSAEQPSALFAANHSAASALDRRPSPNVVGTEIVAGLGRTCAGVGETTGACVGEAGALFVTAFQEFTRRGSTQPTKGRATAIAKSRMARVLLGGPTALLVKHRHLARQCSSRILMNAADASAAAGAPKPRAPSGELFALKVSVCAWCGARAIHGMWDDVDVVLRTYITGHRHLVSHTMCPSCFGEHMPNTRYPDSEVRDPNSEDL
jgi:hypothetical protein